MNELSSLIAYTKIFRRDPSQLAASRLRLYYKEIFKDLSKHPLTLLSIPHKFDPITFCDCISKPSILPPPPSYAWPQSNSSLIEDLIDFIDYFRGYVREEVTSASELKLDYMVKYHQSEVSKTSFDSSRSKDLLEAAAALLAFSRNANVHCRAVIPATKIDLNCVNTLRVELERVRLKSKLDVHIMIVSPQTVDVANVPHYKIDLNSSAKSIHDCVKNKLTTVELRNLVLECSGCPALLHETVKKRLASSG